MLSFLYNFLRGIRRVAIVNSETGPAHELFVRRRRLGEFLALVARAPRTPEPPVRMPGLSWAAICGLDAVFDRRPKKFPAQDIVAWLGALAGTGPANIEAALEGFSKLRPPDVSGGE